MACSVNKVGKRFARALSYFDMQMSSRRSFALCLYHYRENRGEVEGCTQLHSVQRGWQHGGRRDAGTSHLELFTQRRRFGTPAVQLGNGLHGDWHGLLHRVSVCDCKIKRFSLCLNCMREQLLGLCLIYCLFV